MPRRNTPADAAHARFAPSSAHRWLNCPGSILLHEQMRAEPGYVEPPAGEAAVLGQRLHGLADDCLSVMDLEMAMASIHNNDRPLIEPYVREVRAIIDSCIEMNTPGNGPPELHTEMRYMTGIRDCWGTVDAVVVNDETREVWIVDLKTGHQRIDAEENPQLLIYAIGVLRALGRDDALGAVYPPSDRPWTFHLKIVQPRDEEQPVKSWTCSEDYVESFRRLVRVVVTQVQRVTGPWCLHCPGGSRCPEQQALATSVFSEDLPSTPSQLAAITTTANGTLAVDPRNAATLNENQLAFFINNRAKIRAFLDACEERAMQAPPPGWKIVQARTNRRWTDPERVVFAIRNANREDLIRTQPPTIGDAERALGRTNPIIQEFAVAPPGGPTLAPESDPRPSFQPALPFRAEEG